MPELPEVETVRRGLAELLPGREFRAIRVLESPKSFPNSEEQVGQFLVGSRVRGVRRRAKVLIIDLTTDYSLVVHLKMTGQLVFRAGPVGLLGTAGPAARSAPEIFSVEPKTISGAAPPRVTRTNVDPKPQALASDFGGGHPTDSLIGELPDSSTRVEFEFTDGSRLFFNDQRKFGWVKLVPTLEVENMPFFQKVGPEPLEPETTVEEFIKRIRRRNGTMIKPAILDQTVIAGVGNIYADEALWAAKIHPETRTRNVSDESLNTLFNEIRKVLALSIEKGGSTDRNYVDAEGRRGSYLSFAKVFRRENQPCHRHPDELICKLKVAGRGTHICLVCQPKMEDE